MLKIWKTGKFAKCHNACVSLEADFVDECERKVNARRFSWRGILFSNGFPQTSVTLPHNAGRPYFRHTGAGELTLKSLEHENLVSEGPRDGQIEFDIRSTKFP
ncbi:hypothetical protein TNCV_41931 [Trichonephila clavipes]|nr:hypothetical protein TNCV_41931 [Trichonephila clavipes]